MKTLIMTIGLPRSGKSTWARKQGFPIVNPDSIRLALYGKPFILEAEKMVWSIAEYMTKALFLAGHDTVILDATNLTKKRRDFCHYKLWKREYVYFDTSKKVCIERAHKDKRLDLIPVIKEMDMTKEIDMIEVNMVIMNE
jgi:predicted kinase